MLSLSPSIEAYLGGTLEADRDRDLLNPNLLRLTADRHTPLVL